MDIKSFSAAGIFFDLESIQLGAVTDKIVVLVDAGSLSVHTAKAITPYIQKKRKRPFNIRTKTFPDLRMNDDTGKTFRIQRQIAPSQAVAEPLGYLVLQPAEVRKFMEDHYRKVRQIA